MVAGCSLLVDESKGLVFLVKPNDDDDNYPTSLTTGVYISKPNIPFLIALNLSLGILKGIKEYNWIRFTFLHFSVIP